jgi:PAS domain S-box-containing protein
MGSTPPTGGEKRGGTSETPASLSFIGKVPIGKERVRTCFETYPLPMFVFHEETLTFLAVNPAAVRHFGYTEEEFLRLTIKDIRPPAEVEDLLRNLGSSSAAFVRAGIWRHWKKNGQWMDDEVTWVSLVVDGQPCRLVIVLDVTERRWAEELLKSINAETERRLEARTMELQVATAETEAFVHALAQDTQAPLRMLQEYSDQLAAELSNTGPRANEINQKLSQTVQRTAELATNLLRLSGLTYQSLSLQQVNMSEVSDRVLRQLQAQEPGRRVETAIEPNVTVFADPDLIEILVEQLLQNSWKFTRPNPQARIEFYARAEPGEMVCFIRDNGVGFEAGVPERLFEPFQRFHLKFEGVGLGLSIVKRIAAKHAGRAWADSRPGQGTTFCFGLPRPAA